MRVDWISPASRCMLAALACLFLLSPVAAQARDLKFQAQLIWATDDDSSPDRNHVRVDAEVRRKLADLPLRWKNYFEVRRVDMVVVRGGSGLAILSDKCKLGVTDIDGKDVEVSLIGKGEPVLKRIQPLPKGNLLVLGGNAPNSTGWLVVLKRVE